MVVFCVPNYIKQIGIFVDYMGADLLLVRVIYDQFESERRLRWLPLDNSGEYLNVLFK